MAYLLLILTVLFWSGNFVLGRGVNEMIPPVALAFLALDRGLDDFAAVQHQGTDPPAR